MTERERIEVIETLFLIQGDNRARYEEMSEEDLKREYERAWANHD